MLCERMMSNRWRFALLLTNGMELKISMIRAVTQDADGGNWLKVELDEATGGDENDDRIPAASAFRSIVNVNCRHVVAAWELADA
jgi:hypothetical protein